MGSAKATQREKAVCGICDRKFSVKEWKERHWVGHIQNHADCCRRAGLCRQRHGGEGS